MRAENVTLKGRSNETETQLKAIEARLLDCEQNSRNANVEIKGIAARDRKKKTV